VFLYVKVKVHTHLV